MTMSLLVFALVAALVAPGELTGVWRMVYEPAEEGRKDVVEPSSGYLVFLANGEYVEFRTDCCDGTSTGGTPQRYRIEGSEVVLTRTRRDGTSYESRLRYRKRARVAYREETNEYRITEAPALAVSETLNYGWAKIYP
jgi:hypothetical protein